MRLYRTQRYVPTHKPRIPFYALKDSYLLVHGCLYNAATCSDDTFKEAFRGYRERFPSPLDYEQRWVLVIYSKIPLYPSLTCVS